MATTQELSNLAARHAHPVGPSGRQTYPMPVIEPRGFRLVFLHFLHRPTPDRGTLMGPPCFRSVVDIDAAKFVELAAVVPADFGQSPGPEEVIGTLRLPPGMTVREVDRQEGRLFELYDLALPAFRRGRAIDQKHVHEFLKLFERLAEQPLMPYYRFVGKDFFTWLDQVKQ